MTYQTEVAADAPLYRLSLDETGTLANSGSASATVTKGAGVTLNQDPAGVLIGGRSALFNSGGTTGFVNLTPSVTISNTWTLEFWFKKTTGTSTAASLWRQGTSNTSSHRALFLNLTNGTFTYQEHSGSLANANITVGAGQPNPADGNWHHIVVVRNVTGLSIYVDGALQGTGTVHALASLGTMAYIGYNTSALSVGGLIDELAVYNTTLSAQRVSDHYQAAMVVPAVVVQSPPMTVSLSSPNAGVKIVNPNATNSVPVMTTSLSTPNAVVKVVGNRTNTAPAMSVSLTSQPANVSAVAYRTVVAPVMTVSVTSPAPVVTTTDTVNVTTYATADRGNSNQTGYFTVLSNGGHGYFQFPAITVPQGRGLDKVMLHVRVFPNDGGIGTPTSKDFIVRRIVNTWTEGSGPPSVTEAGQIPVSAVVPAYADPAPGIISVDITSIAQGWFNGTYPNYGVAIAYVSTSNTIRMYSRENADINLRPKLVTSNAALPEFPAVVTAPAMTVSLTMPQHRSGAGAKGVVAGAGSASVTMPAPLIKTSKSVRQQIHAITLTQLFPGGESRNPDQFVHAPAMEAWLDTISPEVRGGSNGGAVVTGAMEVSVSGTSDTSVSNKTDRRVFVTNAMSLSASIVGVYRREGDRYLAALGPTLDSKDRWFPLDEISGTVANDASYTAPFDIPEGYSNDATYKGAPVLNVQGPKLRPAVRFDGVDDYLYTGSGWAPQRESSSLTLEFSIKTTQQTGVVVAGGVTESIPYPNANTFTPRGKHVIRLVGGKLVIDNGNGVLNTVNKVVADGEWHHVIITLDHGPNNTTNVKTWVMVDGQVEFTRYLLNVSGDSLLPVSAMANSNGAGTSATEFVAGEMAHFIIRTETAISQDTARGLYYEWSEATLIKPTPMVLNVEKTEPRVKGNVKKMLVLYGPGHDMSGLYATTAMPGLTYYSIFASYGLSIQEHWNKTGGREFAFDKDYGGLYRDAPRETPRPFVMHGYLVYAAAIAPGMTSAPGVIKPESYDPNYPGREYYIDDKTGDPRFIDLQKDLVGGVEEYDVVTVMNYLPANIRARASYDGIHSTRFGSSVDVEYPELVGNPLAMLGSVPDYASARDKVRDSILEAAYNGVNLWIPEAHCATHLGLIQAYDKHVTGGNWNVAIDNGESQLNVKAAQLDFDHGLTNSLIELGNVYDYRGFYQGNAHRMIVNTEPDLTDIPSWEYGDRIDRDKYDWLAPHAKITAYDARPYPHLAPGDRIGMEMVSGQSIGEIRNGLGVPRRFIMSARPEGIVGKVISKEVDFYYGPGSTAPVQNPWRNNVYTIVAERGTVVRGRAIGGRIFMEFMDARSRDRTIPIDRKYYNDMVNNGHAIYGGQWAYDERRYKDIVIITVKDMWRRDKRTGNMINDPQDIFYSDKEELDLFGVPYVSMTARGLNWITAADDLPLGDVRAYSPAMQVSVATAPVKSTQGRNIVNKVTGTMRLDIDIVEPANVDNPDVRAKALPMVLNLELRGAGKAIKVVGAMEISLAATPNTTGLGGGDRIYVYLNGENNAVLFMKED